MKVRKCRTRSNRRLPICANQKTESPLERAPGTLNRPGALYVLCVDGPGSHVISLDTDSLPTQLLDFARDVGN